MSGIFTSDYLTIAKIPDPFIDFTFRLISTYYGKGSSPFCAAYRESATGLLEVKELI
jgi:hypothetical protein